MIPSAEKWGEIAALRQGDLARIPYPVLLTALSRTGRTAVLELDRKPVEKKVIFEAGTPIDCRSNLVHETFGRYLVNAGKLTDEDHNAALAESFSRDVPLGEILLERELIDPVEMYRQLQQNLARKLLDGFTWRDGAFRISDESPGAGSGLKVKAPQLIFTGIFKLSPMSEVSKAIQPLFAEPIAANPAPPVSGEELRLSGGAAKVLEALEQRPRGMDELATLGIGADDLGRIVYALALLEIVIPSSQASATRMIRLPSREAASTRAVELPGAEAGAEAAEDLDRRRRQVMESFLTFRRKDSFDLLGVAEDASRAEIERSYLEQARLFAPWRLEGVSADLAEKARTLFLAAAEAWAELGDNERRGALIHRRKVRREERAARPAARQRIQTDLLDSELQFAKGMEIVGEGDWSKGLEYLQFAADCDPQNPRYRAEAAYCRYRALHAYDRAKEDLEEAIRIDPSCGIAHYHLGRIEGEEGRRESAEEHLRRAIKLMAPDRRPIDALKELGKR